MLNTEENHKCISCFKPSKVCYCHEKADIGTRLKVLILQHPQEPKELLSTAPLVTSIIKNASVKVGLSWANFKKATDESQNPKQWAVVYLGAGIKKPEGIKELPGLQSVNFVDKKGYLYPPAEQKQLVKNLKGVIFLDGTWSQAKTLWWRNAWLLKLSRLVLIPKTPSAYGKLRREPKKECLSTLESIAFCLNFFEENEAAQKLQSRFEHFLMNLKS